MPPSPAIARSLRHGTPVVIAAQAATQLVTFGVLAVLYRVLGMEPYGLLGMIVPLSLLLQVFMTGGLDVATLQREHLDDRQLSALFWMTQGLGLAMAAVTAACGPLLAWFYGVPDLLGLTLALSGIAPVTVLGTQHLALLQRRLRLGAVALLRLVAVTLSGLAAVGAALAGWGVWSLVVQQYAGLLALAAGAWLLEPWRPRFALRGTGARPIVRFGGHYTLSSLMFYLTQNVDKVLVGYFLGPVALGLYSQAFTLMMKPVSMVMSPLTAIMMPVLCRAASDRTHYTALVLGFFRFIALVMLPAGAGLLIVAPEAMRVIGGPKWAAAGPVLAALAAAVLVQGFFNALGSVLVSAGRADRLFHASALIAAVFVTAFSAGLAAGQKLGDPLVAVALSYSLTMVLVVFPPYVTSSLRLVGVPPGAWLRELGTIVPATLGMAALVAACHVLLGTRSGAHDAVLLAAELLLGVASYALFARREIRRFLLMGLGAS